MKILILNNKGDIIAQVDEKDFPLKLPIKTKSGVREYYVKIHHTERGQIRSAQMNTQYEDTRANR